jgi:predicted 3-demethylubiquinone-9 3-methyltransferase (glyoxalase superfamily)
MAWRHHYRNNPHHWQYWLDKNGEPEEIPIIYLEQMIADWECMAIKFGDTAQQYYLNNYKRINLEYNTRLLLEHMLDLNDSMTHNYGHTLEDFASKYDETTFNSYFGWIKDKYGVDTYKILK